jgi:cytochrome b561
MLGAFALVALIGMHVGAALFHHFIRRDGVLTRMLPSLPRRDRA